MATKSSNTQGNPYHDEATGEFTSAGSGSAKTEQVEATGIRLKPGVDLSTIKARTAIRLKEGATLSGFAERLRDISSTTNIPKLTSARDIEAHITEFFSKQVIGKVNELYASSPDCASYQFHPKSNPRMTLEIFPNVLGKYRYPDNHAKIVSVSEFNQLSRSWTGERIFRGISSSGEKARGIVNSYGRVDLNNFDYYCPNGGNCYGSNIYTTVQRSYAASYAWGGTMIEGLLDSRNSWSMSYDSVRRIMNNIDATAVFDKVSAHLESSGLDHDRAQRIAKSFSNAIKQDPGITAILMGLDYYIADGHQRNLFNLGKWIIKEV